MYRTLIAVAGVLAAALFAVQLTFSSAALTPADFTFINGTEPKTLDPGTMTGQPEGRIADAIFEGLTRWDARTMRPVPGAAQAWEISPDGLTYVFRLREDAVWGDGRPVTAHDFAYAWRRLEDPRRGAEYAYLLHMVRGAEAFNTHGGHAAALRGPLRAALEALRRDHPDGVEVGRWRAFVAEHRLDEAVEDTQDRRLAGALAPGEGRIRPEQLAEIAEAMAAEADRRSRLFDEAAESFGRDAGVFARDDRTLVVELVAPTPYFLELTAFFPTYPVPRWLVEAPGNDRDWFLPRKLVSNGPFRLQSWRVNDRIRLVRSDTYWGRDEVYLESIDVLPIENATTALNLYLTGAVHWLPQLYPSDLADDLRRRPDFYSAPGMVVYYYRFNTRRPPLDDPRVREALAVSIDRQAIVENVLGLGQLPAFTVVPPGIAGYESPASRIAFDPARGRRLLAEAGHPRGEGFPKIGILYNTQETHKKIAEVIADQLRRNLGIRVKAYNQEWQSYLASMRAGDFDVARAGWVGDYLDPNTFLDLWMTNRGNNQTGWGDPVYDELVRAAADVQGFAAAPGPLIRRLKEPQRARALLAAWRDADSAAGRLAAAARVRMHLLREAEAILVQDAFAIAPIYFYVVSGLIDPGVRGFYVHIDRPDGTRAINLQDRHPLRSLRVEREVPRP